MNNQITVNGATGLRPKQGFLCPKGEMIYVGNDIGKDLKGNKYKIVSTTLSQSEEEKRRGIRNRSYNVQPLN
jgi:hypothetical protein